MNQFILYVDPFIQNKKKRHTGFFLKLHTPFTTNVKIFLNETETILIKNGIPVIEVHSKLRENSKILSWTDHYFLSKTNY